MGPGVVFAPKEVLSHVGSVMYIDNLRETIKGWRGVGGQEVGIQAPGSKPKY